MERTGVRPHRIWGGLESGYNIDSDTDQSIDWCPTSESDEDLSPENVSPESVSSGYFRQDAVNSLSAFNSYSNGSFLQTEMQNTTTAVPVVKLLGSADGARRAKLKAEPRLAVHIHIHMTAPCFSPVGLVIGKGGCNLRRIAQFTGAYLRVRGRGSGYLEAKGRHEAPTPLMIAVTGSADDPLSFRKAVWLTLQHLSAVEARFLTYCEKQGFRAMGGPHFHIGFVSAGAVTVLSDV